MGDLEWLFVILAGLYLFECGFWLRRGMVATLRMGMRRWRIVHPGAALGNLRGGVIVANPLPPLGTIFVSQQIPVSISPKGILSFVGMVINPVGRGNHESHYVEFDQIKSIKSDGKKLLVNDRIVIKANSPGYACWLRRNLQKIKESPERSRDRAIDHMLREMLNHESVTKQIADFERLAKTMTVLANVLFVYLFVIVPLVVWKTAWANVLWILVPLLFALTFSIAFLFRSAHKKLFPDGDEERFTAFLTSMLAAPTAMRARDTLSKGLLERFHPLAVANVLCSRDDFLAFAGSVVRDLRFPMILPAFGGAGDPVETERWFRARWSDTVEDWLKNRGVNAAEFVSVPVRVDEGNRTYCPRCLSQYTLESGTCNDCGGICLERLDCRMG